MKAGSFVLNGINSEEFEAVIQSRPLLNSPRRRIDFRSAFGVDGLIPYDEGAYDNTEIDLVLYAEATTNTTRREELHDLFNSNTYLDLILYNDPTKIYKVMVAEPLSFETRFYMGEGMAFSVKLTAKPYKYLVDAPLKVLTTAGGMFNPTTKPSLPLITVYGSGTIRLTFNGIDFDMKNIVDYVVLDSENLWAYKDDNGFIVNQNGNIYTREYPFLKPGTNAISWTGTVTKVEILPKWRTLV